MKKNNENQNLVEKAEELKSLVDDFTHTLPTDKINDLRYHLIGCLTNFPNNIERGLTTERKIDRIKSFIKASGELNQCRDYLQLLSRMKIAHPDELIMEIEDFNATINNPEFIIKQHVSA